jgi:signal transduction histidine kinase
VELYTRKKRWKLFLFILGLLIIAASLFYTNLIVTKFAQTERKNVKLWADAVQRKVRLVEYTDRFFKQLRQQEREKVELLVDVYKHIMSDSTSRDLTFYLNILNKNKTIPVILTDKYGFINSANNVDWNLDTVTRLTGKLKEEFSVYPPIKVPNVDNYLYYNNSRLYYELQNVLNDYISSFMSEVTLNSSSVPVIITDSTKENILQFGNLNAEKMKDPEFAQRKLREMKKENEPIILKLDRQTSYIFYKDSELLTQMKLFPIAQILIIGFFLFIAYLLFSASRKSEQNRVWAGMAKETAHQLGTPLSSILAWLELLKLDEGNIGKAVEEIEKDVKRLEMISERFSKIGSTPSIENNNLIKIINDTVNYLKPRTPRKVIYRLDYDPAAKIFLPVNSALFSWVLENLFKNAIDAMNGKGQISIAVQQDENHVFIDISDTGKGISITEQKAIFNPGYTSKKRGWGLGLSLAKRIIKDYHNGKIFVKSSSAAKGTTFRIVLKKN